MSKLHFSTKHANEATVQRKWYVVDGTNQTVGRMCAKIAAVLRGKTRLITHPTLIAGISSLSSMPTKLSFPVIRWKTKSTLTFSGYPGGLKGEAAKDLLKRRPEVVIERAVKGMLPKNRLGRKMYKNCLYMPVPSIRTPLRSQPL